MTAAQLHCAVNFHGFVSGYKYITWIYSSSTESRFHFLQSFIYIPYSNTLKLLGGADMKFTIITMATAAILFSILNAEPVDRLEAQVVAEARLIRDGMEGNYSIEYCVVLEDKPDFQTLAFVFELSPAGYIVTSADNELPPVIAYSYMNNCGAGDEENSILLDMIATDMKFRLLSLDEAPSELLQLHRSWWAEYSSGEYELLDDRLLDQWPPAGSTPTGGWLMENWTQGSPYNDYCPMDLTTHTRSAAGCPAVAMGSILNFGGTTNGTQFNDTDDYYHNFNEFYWIDDDYVAHDFPSWPELNIYLDTLENHYANFDTITSSDKAALVYASGAACKQVYTSSVSGTFGVTQAYDAYLRFGFTGCSLLNASSDSLYQKLSDNMKSAIPAHLAIVDDRPHYGHNLVIDGYNSDDFYHMNFGWGGGSNGWYQFPLSGMPYNMNIIEGIILDIGDGPQSVEGEAQYGDTRDFIMSCGTNPVSEYLVVDLSVIQNCRINVSVYGISGRLIGTIADDVFSQGTHSFSWSPGNAMSGVYFVRASSANGNETVKFTLLE